MSATALDRELVDVLRRNADLLARDMITRFDQAYPDSSIRSLNLPERIAWIKVELERINEVIVGERQTVPTCYQPDVSGTSDSHPLGLASLLNVVENGLFIEESVLPVLWREFGSDSDRLFAAVSRFKTSLRVFINEKAESVANAIAEDLVDARATAAAEARERLVVDAGSRLSRYMGRLREQTVLAQNLLIEGKLDEAIVELTALKLTESEAVEVFGSPLLARAEESATVTPSATESTGKPAVETRTTAAASLVEALSPRELEVVVLVSAGKTNAEIASSLHLAESTVKNYLGSILDKLGLSNRTQIAIFAERSGMF